MSEAVVLRAMTAAIAPIATGIAGAPVLLGVIVGGALVLGAAYLGTQFRQVP